MRTPKEYENNIRKRIITFDMLAKCIYSVNKRAKNCRDKKREYIEVKYNNPYWKDKYDNIDKYKAQETEYYDMKDKLLSLLKPQCIHRKPSGEYFLYYTIGNYSFHSPIDNYSKDEYKDLEVIDIDSLSTTGREINDLVSVPFVKKVIDLIKSGDYTLESN